MNKDRYNALKPLMSASWHRHQAELAAAVAKLEAELAAKKSS